LTFALTPKPLFNYCLCEKKHNIGAAMPLNQKTENELFDKYNDKPGFLIPLLQDIQETEGYISKDAIKFIEKRFGLKPAEIYGVATFYSMFRLKPIGKHAVKICKGTACHVSGEDNLILAIRAVLNLRADQDTTDDGLYTLIEVACIGCCSLAPALIIDDKIIGNVTMEMVKGLF
jgi:NADH-quinone oxidoreductase subunit E